MSDDMKQMMRQMMQQMQQQQNTINKLTKALEMKNNSSQSSILKPNYEFYFGQNNQSNLYGKSYISQPNYNLNQGSSIKRSEIKTSYSNKQSITSCPQQHYNNSIYLDKRFCHYCQSKIPGGHRCIKCQYCKCRNCQYVNHDDYCQNPIWQPYIQSRFCVGCGETAFGGKSCTKCKFSICRSCESIDHATFCQNQTYKYHSQSAFCLTCGQKKVGGKQCLKCSFLICNSCGY